MNNMSNECLEHSGEQKKLFCIEPCKVSLCQDCFKFHKGHEIRSLDEVIEELRNYLDERRKEKKEEQTVCGNQIEILERLKSDTETLLKSQIEEEKRMEQIVLEPLQDIINRFQEKINSFLNSLVTKKESCEHLEDQAYNNAKMLEADNKSMSILIKKEDWCGIYELWLKHLHNSSESNNSSDREALLDVDALKDYAEDLKNLNVLGQMKIVVQSFTNALQTENVDQVSRFADKLALSNEDMKALQETLVHAQGSIKDVSNSIEAMKKEIKNLTVTAMNILKKDEIHNVEENIEKGEKILKKAREKLIEEVQKVNSLYGELIIKQKDLDHMETMNVNTISDWKKGIINCEKEHTLFKKLFTQVNELLEDYGKEIIKYNLNYEQKMEEFGELDAKLQGIREQMRSYLSESQYKSKKTNYKFRISIISIDSKRAHTLIDKFLYNSIEESIKETVKGKKGYSVVATFDIYEVEFCVWNLGVLKTLEPIDDSYITNVEAVLLLYDTTSSNIESIKSALDSLNETAALVVLVGIADESKLEVSQAIKELALSNSISLKVINILSEEEVRELFYGVLYAKYPGIYERINI